MTLTKRVLSSALFLAFARVALRGLRTLYFAGCVPHHHPGLRAFLASGRPAIFGVWHQDFPFTLGYLSRWNPARPTWALASASRDGGVAAAAAEGVGFRGVFRGSSARGGARALLRMHRTLASGRASVAVVCDGPRSHPREMRPGILHLAGESGLPIWLVRTSYAPAAVLGRTWARFLLPAPWAHGVVEAEGPIRVPPDAGREALDALRRDLQERLNRLADRADARAAAARRGSRRL